MARSRNIKPGACKNEALAELGPMTQFLFVMLPCFADKEGRLEDRPRRIKAEIFPYYDADVDAMLQSLADSPEQFVKRYEIDGKRYLQITNFNEHQTPHHKESESIIPACVKHEPTLKQRKSKNDNLGREGIGYRNQESVTRNQESEGQPSDFESWWKHYPRKAAKANAAKAYEKAIARLSGRDFGGCGKDAVGFLWERVVAFAKSDVAKGDYCPHPASWLNAERYDDDPATWQSRGSPNRNDPRGNLALRDQLIAELNLE